MYGEGCEECFATSAEAYVLSSEKAVIGGVQIHAPNETMRMFDSSGLSFTLKHSITIQITITLSSARRKGM